MMGAASLKIGELASKSGVSIDTARYYEKSRLINSIARTSGGYRLFAAETVERIKFIRNAQELGFSLAEIGVLLRAENAEECEYVHDLLKMKCDELDRQIKKMKSFRKTLAIYIAACEKELEAKKSAAHCPVIPTLEHKPMEKNANEKNR